MSPLTRSSQELTLGSKNHGLAEHHVASAATPSTPLSPECGAVTPLDTEPGPAWEASPAPGQPQGPHPSGSLVFPPHLSSEPAST